MSDSPLIAYIAVSKFQYFLFGQKPSLMNVINVSRRTMTPMETWQLVVDERPS